MRSYYMLSPIELMKPIDWYIHTHIHAETHTHMLCNATKKL
jgi:hypothetical protein